MIELIKESLWQQCGAALDTFHDSLKMCPDDLWEYQMWEPDEDGILFTRVWYICYHTLYWTDLFLDGSRENFVPPEKFKWNGPPEVAYTRDEILSYFEYCRNKLKKTIDTLTEEKAQQRCVFSWFECSYLELFLYSMRHVQEHTAQLGLILGKETGSAPDWVPQVRDIPA
ncbi:MAG: DinB family protein [Aggregatilineales bacterium]